MRLIWEDMCHAKSINDLLGLESSITSFFFLGCEIEEEQLLLSPAPASKKKSVCNSHKSNTPSEVMILLHHRYRGGYQDMSVCAVTLYTSPLLR